MRLAPRWLIAALAVIAFASSMPAPTLAQEKGGKIRFGVGPLQPTPSEPRKPSTPSSPTWLRS